MHNIHERECRQTFHISQESLCCGCALKLHTWEHAFRHDMSCDPDLRKVCPSLQLFSWKLSLDGFPHSAVRHARRASCLFVPSAAHLISLSSNKHHACSFSSFSGISSMVSFSSPSMEYESLLPPLGHKAAISPAVSHVHNVLLPPLQRFSCPQRFASLPPLPALYLCAFQLGPFPALQMPLPVPFQTTCYATSKFCWSPSSLELSLSSFVTIPISIGALVPMSCFVLSGLSRPRRRSEQPFVLQCRSAESEVQQTLKQQLLDCEHISSSLILPNLFSNLFGSLTNVLTVSSLLDPVH